ncbi:MAG: hypothetical protein MUE33_10135 [Cytophagaceae bacterium]|jgi:hypothetical protein|nr:hypothetical protein [Cytophagaceae bacterium]
MIRCLLSVLTFILLSFLSTAQTDTIYIEEEEYDTIVAAPVIIEKQVIVYQAPPAILYELTRGLGVKLYSGGVYQFVCDCSDTVSSFVKSSTGTEVFVGLGLGYQRYVLKRWSLAWWTDIFHYQQNIQLRDENLTIQNEKNSFWYGQTSLVVGWDIWKPKNKKWVWTIQAGGGVQYLLNRSGYWPSTGPSSPSIPVEDAHVKWVGHIQANALMTQRVSERLYAQYGIYYQVDVSGPTVSSNPYYFYRNRIGASFGMIYRLQ